jgi:histidine phosphotransferase ChpT
MARQGMDRFKPGTFSAGAALQGSSSPRSQQEADATAQMRLLELLAARLCHELSAPIAAINNGVELLADDDSDPGFPLRTDFSREAATLIGDSARRAASRLQFYRFAYGFGRGSAIAGPAPHELAAAMFNGSRIVCNYSEEVRRLPLDWQKLACNLLSVGAETLPRGGRLILSAEPLNLEAINEVTDLHPDTGAALMLTTPVGKLTSRTIQAFLAGLLAKALDCRLVATTEPGRVRLTALSGEA